MQITPETLAQALDSVDPEQVKTLLSQLQESGTFMKDAAEDHPTNQSLQRFLNRVGFAEKLPLIAEEEGADVGTVGSLILLGFFLGLFTSVEIPESITF